MPVAGTLNRGPMSRFHELFVRVCRICAYSGMGDIPTRGQARLVNRCAAADRATCSRTGNWIPRRTLENLQLETKCHPEDRGARHGPDRCGPGGHHQPDARASPRGLYRGLRQLSRCGRIRDGDTKQRHRGARRHLHGCSRLHGRWQPVGVLDLRQWRECHWQ
jgi:hypothetical protein